MPSAIDPENQGIMYVHCCIAPSNAGQCKVNLYDLKFSSSAPTTLDLRIDQTKRDEIHMICCHILERRM